MTPMKNISAVIRGSSLGTGRVFFPAVSFAIVAHPRVYRLALCIRNPTVRAAQAVIRKTEGVNNAVIAA
jgi:hypothetical protein